MPTRIVIKLNGGLITDIKADDEAEVLVLDDDVEFAHKEDLMILNTFPEPNYPSIPLEFHQYGIEEVEVNPFYVAHYFDQVEAIEAEEEYDD